MEEIDDETEIENDADEMNENESVHKTFINPSQEDIISNESIFRCLQCDFKTATKVILWNTKEKVTIGAHSVCLPSTARKYWKNMLKLIILLRKRNDWTHP